MTIAVIGAKGMLGSELCTLLRSRKTELAALDIGEIDITDKKSVTSALSKIGPQLIINCAAYTNVELAEEEAEQAFAANQYGPKNLAEFASKTGAVLCHISTDYVFNGRKRGPYNEDDPTDPLGTYARSKLAGEEEVRRFEKHFIIRSAWLYGKNERNFVTTIINAARESDQIKVVDDQLGSPTYSVDLAARIMEIVGNLPFGTYHATNSGITSWYNLAKEALKIKGIATVVKPISSNEYPSKVARPKYSVLNNEKAEKAGLAPMPQWQDALRRFLS